MEIGFLIKTSRSFKNFWRNDSDSLRCRLSDLSKNADVLSRNLTCGGKKRIPTENQIVLKK